MVKLQKNESRGTYWLTVHIHANLNYAD